MTQKAETRLQRRIQDAIKKAYPTSFGFKVHGGPFQRAGIPDLVVCIQGLYFGLEVKVPKKGKLSAIQVDTIEKINNAGGIAAEVTSPQEALDTIAKGLREGSFLKPSDVLDRDELLYSQIVITSSGCWEFQGHLTDQRYGRVRRGHTLWRAHRLSFKLAFGDFDLSLDVLHSCDNPPCINPAHLFLGDDADNVKDRERKGRGVRVSGEAHHKAVLTKQAVGYIKRQRAAGTKTLKQLAEKYGVSVSTISAAATGRSWKP